MPGIEWKEIAGMRDWISPRIPSGRSSNRLDVVDKQVPALLRTLQAFKDEISAVSGKTQFELTGIGKDNHPRLGPNYFKWVSNQRNITPISVGHGTNSTMARIREAQLRVHEYVKFPRLAVPRRRIWSRVIDSKSYRSARPAG